ncbi:MAG: nucleotidyltransferase family protein [Candidatus Omnitrophica bacterium]|nr:nucleotidyltransferase family protein [Candidatus Omnitrophota bacterium]
MPSKNKKNFKVLILAGGYATRLYPITLNVSKPLLKIDKRAIIDFAIQDLEKIKGLNEIIVVTNNKFYKDYLKWKKELKLKKKVAIINDETKTDASKLGAVGDMYYTVKKRKINSDLLVIGGDNIFERGLSGFVNFAQEKSPHVSIGTYDLISKFKARRYGVVQIGKDHQILDFQEKPEYPLSTEVAMCMYYFPKDTLTFFKEYVKKLKLDTDKAGSYIKWLMVKGKIFGFRFKGLWLDIGQVDTYRKAQRYFYHKKKF